MSRSKAKAIKNNKGLEVAGGAPTTRQAEQYQLSLNVEILSDRRSGRGILWNCGSCMINERMRIIHADQEQWTKATELSYKNHDSGFKEALSQAEGMGRPTK